jgi:hypothetical protein
MPDIQCTPRTRQSFTIRLEGGGCLFDSLRGNGHTFGGGCNSTTVQQVVLLDDVVQLGIE